MTSPKEILLYCAKNTMCKKMGIGRPNIAQQQLLLCMTLQIVWLRCLDLNDSRGSQGCSTPMVQIEQHLALRRHCA